MRFESRGPSEDSTPRIRQRSELTEKAKKQRTGTMQSKCKCYQPWLRIIALTLVTWIIRDITKTSSNNCLLSLSLTLLLFLLLLLLLLLLLSSSSLLLLIFYNEKATSRFLSESHIKADRKE